MKTIEMTVSKKNPINIEFTKNSSSSNNYNQLINKPSINGKAVQGDKLGEDYKLQNKMDILTVQEIEKILYLD